MYSEILSVLFALRLNGIFILFQVIATCVPVPNRDDKKVSFSPFWLFIFPFRLLHLLPFFLTTFGRFLSLHISLCVLRVILLKINVTSELFHCRTQCSNNLTLVVCLRLKTNWKKKIIMIKSVYEIQNWEFFFLYYRTSL